jgi:hypothetical protein
MFQLNIQSFYGHPIRVGMDKRGILFVISSDPILLYSNNIVPLFLSPLKSCCVLTLLSIKKQLRLNNENRGLPSGCSQIWLIGLTRWKRERINTHSCDLPGISPSGISLQF